MLQKLAEVEKVGKRLQKLLPTCSVAAIHVARRGGVIVTSYTC